MGKKQTINGRGTVHWISTQNLPKLKVKKHGYIGGCILIHYVITVDGEVYFIK